MTGDRKPELLILNRAQFGYHLGTYDQCKFAVTHLRITYVGFDKGLPRLHMKGVEIKYVAYKGRRLRRYLRLLAVWAREVRKFRGAIFVAYFPGCSLLRLIGPRARMIVDVRAGSISRNRRVRGWEDRLMRWECRRFRYISVVSQSLAERLHLPERKTHILPLGADPMWVEAKRFDRLDLLYVGTLDGRRIEDTVLGFERFLQDYGGKIALTYTVVGYSHNGELEKLRQMVRVKGLDDVVHLPGFVHRTHLQEVFGRCNVGVSYVPISDIYDCQPATKTFEYIFAGMPVIATATTENKKVVSRLNGVLIPDTPEGFYDGLEEVYARRREFDSGRIRSCCPESSWDRIVSSKFVPYIQDVCQSSLE